jgi:hypothetical protein
MSWCSVKAQGQLYLYLVLEYKINLRNPNDLHLKKDTTFNQHRNQLGA